MNRRVWSSTSSPQLWQRSGSPTFISCNCHAWCPLAITRVACYIREQSAIEVVSHDIMTLNDARPTSSEVKPVAMRIRAMCIGCGRTQFSSNAHWMRIECLVRPAPLVTPPALPSRPTSSTRNLCPSQQLNSTYPPALPSLSTKQVRSCREYKMSVIKF